MISADLRWPDGTGIGVCQQELLLRLRKNVEIVDIEVRGRIGSSTSPLRIATALAFNRERSDAFWSPGFIPPAWSQVPSVVTVHDLTHLHFYSKFHAAYYNLILKPLYKRCAAVICVSDYTRDEFLEWSDMDPHHVHTIHNGVSTNFHRNAATFNVGHPYILYPGNKRPYKNVNGLLRAFRSSRLPSEGFKVVMTGSATPELQKAISSLDLQDAVIFLGHVPDEQLPALYRGARLTVFVSLYEGFGLPIVESMAVGTPVITSNVSSMPEMAGDAALIVPPLDIEAVAHAMDRLAFESELRTSLITKGFDRASSFSWDAAAASTWDVIRSAVGSGR